MQEKIKYTVYEDSEGKPRMVKSDDVCKAIDLYGAENVYLWDGNTLKECDDVMLIPDDVQLVARVDEMSDSEAEKYKGKTFTVHDYYDADDVDVEVVDITDDCDFEGWGYEWRDSGYNYHDEFFGFCDDGTYVVGEWEQVDKYKEYSADYPKQELTIIHVFDNGRKIREFVPFEDTEWSTYEYVDDEAVEHYLSEVQKNLKEKYGIGCCLDYDDDAEQWTVEDFKIGKYREDFFHIQLQTYYDRDEDIYDDEDEEADQSDLNRWIICFAYRSSDCLKLSCWNGDKDYYKFSEYTPEELADRLYSNHLYFVAEDYFEHNHTPELVAYTIRREYSYDGLYTIFGDSDSGTIAIEVESDDWDTKNYAEYTTKDDINAALEERMGNKANSIVATGIRIGCRNGKDAVLVDLKKLY